MKITDLSIWVTPTCEWRAGKPTPVVAVGDRVTMCTASFEWIVTAIAQDGLIVLAPTDTRGTTHVAHAAHLDVTKAAPRADEPEPTDDTPSMLDLLEEAT